jgi:hypothetical protein
MTNLISLMVFAKVVEADSFSGGARLKCLRRTVSCRVTDLGEHLGVRIDELSTLPTLNPYFSQVGSAGNRVGVICVANSLNSRHGFEICRLPR